ncbi:MAG: hypothetical protein ACREB9_02785 [Thermoplasmata archaeon]
MVGARSVRGRPRLVLASVLLLVLIVGLLGAPAAQGTPTATPAPLTGTVQGVSILGLNGTGDFTLNATGGPAVAPNGTLIGNLSYYASVQAGNLTGVTVQPTFGALLIGSNYTIYLTVGPAPQPVTLLVEFTSVYLQENVSINITTTVNVVVPYVLTGEVTAGNLTVLPFTIAIYLDGTLIGSQSVPTMTAGESYNFTFNYLTASLSAGYHTFVLTLPSQHQQVHFANGATSYSITFYVAGPAVNYTLYYALGVVAFVGVILIFLILVGARRRPGTR